MASNLHQVVIDLPKPIQFLLFLQECINSSTIYLMIEYIPGPFS